MQKIFDGDHKFLINQKHQ